MTSQIKHPYSWCMCDYHMLWIKIISQVTKCYSSFDPSKKLGAASPVTWKIKSNTILVLYWMSLEDELKKGSELNSLVRSWAEEPWEQPKWLLTHSDKCPYLLLLGKKISHNTQRSKMEGRPPQYLSGNLLHEIKKKFPMEFRLFW